MFWRRSCNTLSINDWKVENFQYYKFLVFCCSEFGIDDPLTNSVLEKKLEHTVYQELINCNFDSVDVEDYSVVVTYPDPNRPNQLEVLDQSGSVLANFTLKNSVSRGDNPMGKTVSAKSRYAKYPYVAFTKAGYAEVSNKLV